MLSSWERETFPLSTFMIRGIDMSLAGSMVRLFSMLGVIGIALSSVAHGAVDRKAARDERVKRVLSAREAGRPVAHPNVITTTPQQSYIERLIYSAQFSLRYEKDYLWAENRLYARLIRVGQQTTEGGYLSAMITRNLGNIVAVQGAIAGTLSDLSSFTSVGPGVAAAFNRLTAAANQGLQKTAAVESRPPFPVPPASLVL
jgi:hypothetical protein